MDDENDQHTSHEPCECFEGRDCMYPCEGPEDCYCWRES
jgi:hypothetical protein